MSVESEVVATAFSRRGTPGHRQEVWPQELSQNRGSLQGLASFAKHGALVSRDTVAQSPRNGYAGEFIFSNRRAARVIANKACEPKRGA